jgi:hypothetical protein
MNPLAQAYINTIALGRSQYAKTQTKNRLEQLGLLLHFPHVPDGWITAIPPIDLTSIWQNAGVSVSGVGYLTIGKIISGSKTSGRYWPTSPYYQARLGGYLIRGTDKWCLTLSDQPDLEKFMQVVTTDQLAWLKIYGCPDPGVMIKPDSFQVIAESKHQDFDAWEVRYVISSKSDVGAGNRYLNRYISYRTFEYMFQWFGGVHLPTLCTLPPIWPLASYHALELDFYGILVRVGDQGHWCLLYSCGARWGEREYFFEIEDEALQSLWQARIVSI